MYRRVFSDQATETAFLLGGIGTGNISIGSRGQFKDAELFNKPGKGNVLPYFFFTIYIKDAKGKVVTRVLESELKPPFTRTHGYWTKEAAGLPRLKSAQLWANYPYVHVEFEDPELPVKVALEAYPPFIPLNLKDSSLPCFSIRYKVINHGNEPVEVTVTGNLPNVAGAAHFEKERWESIRYAAPGISEFRTDSEQRFSGLWYYTELPDSHHHKGSLCLVTGERQVTYTRKWLNRGNWDGLEQFWRDLSEDGRLEPEPEYSAKQLPPEREEYIGSLGLYKTIEPHAEEAFEFVMAWHYPNRSKGWGSDWPVTNEDGTPAVVRNHYAKSFADAWEVASYFYKERQRLALYSSAFAEALYGSTLPGESIDAIASNITVLRSPTCFVLEDGTFLTWEGCFASEGCCEGSCTHVWNYAQTAAFLYPELEHSLRRTELLLETDEEGRMAFRTHQVFGLPKWDYHPAADGQLGVIIRLYRDWKLSGDSGLLAGLWPKAVQALEFAFKYWDSDGDFVLDSEQHNTYDIEFYGPNSLVNSLFFTALKAASEMARSMGDQQLAERYEQAFAQGSRRMDEWLWNGEGYVQSIANADDYLYQYGEGCLSDQVFGQMLAHLTGLGYILPEEHVKKAIHAVYRHNFKADMSTHLNVQRSYALPGERGLVLCSWPQGGRPRQPFIYSDEVWTGVEYQAASHLIEEGYVEEGIEIVRAIRDRYDGRHRNPFDETETGSHYVRSMASWMLLTSLSGYRYDLGNGWIGFDPKVNQADFSCFFSHSKGWGIYRQKLNAEGELVRNLETLYGTSEGIEVRGGA
ncbi:GH116 family glycosyl-hydrolase [Paenibacillus montanisoli]|uniref:Beta-glucosidase n=1 Tax=Paenibacillus montanisoli TaxID=2081970 RepID=A0A328TZJ6_9BACL|nr:GH116 family glycosyl-hydrolase [Paenibacillus montanisoli]RAP74591.1 hypothetical protein DL346_21260 [Paenibacillus montanisoli]